MRRGGPSTSAILSDPSIQLYESLRSKRIYPFVSDGPRLHKAGVFEDPQMPRHARLPDRHSGDEIVDRALLGEQQLDDLQPVGIGKDLEWIYIHYVDIGCQGCALGFQTTRAR